jgi:hypothetical protein
MTFAIVQLPACGIESFSTCHFCAMTEPNFLLHDEWTGYSFFDGDDLCFDGVEGDDVDVAMIRIDQFPNANIPSGWSEKFNSVFLSE